MSTNANASPNVNPKKKQPTEQDRHDSQRRTAVIGGHILQTLGQPVSLHRLQVHQLWDDHYRVNVLVGADATSIRIAHSYFVVSDGAGNIVASTPKLTKEY